MHQTVLPDLNTSFTDCMIFHSWAVQVLLLHNCDKNQAPAVFFKGIASLANISNIQTVTYNVHFHEQIDYAISSQSKINSLMF